MTTSKVIEPSRIKFPLHYRNRDTGTVVLMIQQSIGIVVSVTSKSTGELDEVLTGVNLFHPSWERCPSVTTFEC